MTTNGNWMRNEEEGRWYVYLLECEGGGVYTGITTDLCRRMREHAAGIGGRYTRSFPPRRLRAAWRCLDRGTAAAAERRIKNMRPADKRRLGAGLRAVPARWQLSPVHPSELPPADPR